MSVEKNIHFHVTIYVMLEQSFFALEGQALFHLILSDNELSYLVILLIFESVVIYQHAYGFLTLYF